MSAFGEISIVWAPVKFVSRAGSSGRLLEGFRTFSRFPVLT